MVFNTVQARATELGGSATMLTEFGECTPYFDHPDYQGRIEQNNRDFVIILMDQEV